MTTSPTRHLEMFFDCSSPWTYLAFHRVQAVIAETGCAIAWRPILVGGVFNAVNQGLYQHRAGMTAALREDAADASGASRKARYYVKDLADWARFCDLRIGQPAVFPVNSVRAMRACFVAERHGRMTDWVRAIFESYWGDLEDISQSEVLADVASRVGLEPGALLEEIEQPECKARLRANTDELIARGGFGSPTFFVDRSDMYFGNDRLDLVRAALAPA